MKKQTAPGERETITQRSFNLIEYKSLDVDLIDINGRSVIFTFLDDAQDGKPEGAFYVSNEGRSPSQWLSCKVPIKIKTRPKDVYAEFNIPEGESFNVEFTYSGQPLFIVEIESGRAARLRTFDLKGNELAMLQISGKPEVREKQPAMPFFDPDDPSDVDSSVAIFLDSGNQNQVDHLAYFFSTLVKMMESGNTECAIEHCEAITNSLFKRSNAYNIALYLYRHDSNRCERILDKAVSAEVDDEGRQAK